MKAIFTLSLWALSLGCSGRKAPTDDPNVVARINGEVVSLSTFEKELAREMQISSAPTPEQVEPFKQSLLNTVIERTLLLQEARKQNVTVTPEEVERRVLRMRADFPTEGFNEILEQSQNSISEIKRQTQEQLLIEKLFETHVYPRVAATEAELRQWFDQHSADFSKPERVRASQIFVRDLSEARRLEQQVRSGKKFAEIARKYSLSPEARVGGDLGYFPRGVMPAAFDEALFRMSPGQVSSVIETEYGYHVFLLTEKVPARSFNFDEIKDAVEQKLLAFKQHEAQKAWLSDLRQKADIRINDDALSSVAWKNPPSHRPLLP